MPFEGRSGQRTSSLRREKIFEKTSGNMYDPKRLGEINRNMAGRQFCNHKGSGVDRPGNFIRVYQNILATHNIAYDPNCEGVCAVDDCKYERKYREPDTCTPRSKFHGGHVLFKGSEDCWLVPLCPKHNAPTIANDSRPLRKDIIAVKLYENVNKDVLQSAEDDLRRH